MKITPANDDAWVAEVEKDVKTFCQHYKVIYKASKRERAASFEIGCLHMVLRSYEKGGTLHPENLNPAGEFQYLTTPSGNPENFSWVRVEMPGETFQIRQQVRVKSHWHTDIAFCPDVIVLKPNAQIQSCRDPDYASGKRAFYSVSSGEVISAHECKSLTPFPELLVSFIGLFQAAHAWFDQQNPKKLLAEQGQHLAPCLFVGGESSPLQRKMIKALEEVFPINIITGLHNQLFKPANIKRISLFTATEQTLIPVNAQEVYESPF